MNRLIRAALALLLLAAAPGSLSAQQGAVQQQTAKVTLSTFPTDDPRARRAAEFLEPLLRGDFAAAEAYLTQHAAPNYGRGEEMAPASDVAAEFAGYTLMGYEQLAEDGDALTVWVRKGEDVRGVQIRIGTDAPHRIQGIRKARIRMMSGPPRDGRRP